MSETGFGSTERVPDRRKLVAVLYADMVGYSRLIGIDRDAAAHGKILRKGDFNLLVELIDPHPEFLQRGRRVGRRRRHV